MTEAIAPVGTQTINAFSSEANFEAAMRIANLLTSANLVPEHFRGKANLPNAVIALQLAARMGADPLMIMQNLSVIHGRPSWSAQFLIATVNDSGRFSPLRYRFEGDANTDAWGCRAYAKDLKSGEECVGALITIGLAKAEGWATKSGSKWRTMPEQMLMYRAASFWARVYCPELSMGMHTREEIIDVHGEDVTGRTVATASALPSELAPGDTKALGAALLAEPTPQGEVIDMRTGEVLPP